MRSVALGFAAVALAALVDYVSNSSSGRARADWLYGHVSYYCIAALVLSWVAVAARRLAVLGFGQLKSRRPHGLAAAVGLGVAALVFLSVPPRFRVLSDETNLLGVAQSMTLEKSVYNLTIAKRFYGNMFPIQREVEKRPLLYPFLVHLAHLTTGYRWQNGFAVNFVLFAALLASIFAWAASRAGNWAGASAVLLVASYPLVSLCASSSGAELLAVVVFGLMMLALGGYLLEPGPDSLAFLWITALLFCHTRYESFILAALALAAAALARGVRRADLAPWWWLYALSLLLLAPLVFQRVLIPRPFENVNVPPFSPRHFMRFATELLQAQLKPYDRTVPHSIVLNWAALACLGVLAWAWRQGRIGFPDRWRAWWAGTAAACVFVQLLIFLFYYFGSYIHPASSRFFLLLAVCGALVPVALHALLPATLPRPWLVTLALGCALLYHPIAVGAWHTNALELIREARACHRFVLERGEEHAFYIYSRPGQVTVLGYGAADFAWANQRAEPLLNELRRRLYSDIFVLQRVSYETGAPVKDDALDARFSLEPVSELQITGERTLRVSRVRR